MITIDYFKPGKSFYIHGQKYHFVGVTGYDETVVVYWRWNKWKKIRTYIVEPMWAFEITMEYITKTKREFYATRTNNKN